MTFLINLHWHHWLLVSTTIFHLIASLMENKSIPAPGKLLNIRGNKIHLYLKGEGNITVILDHSLSGIEGYFLIDKIAEITQVCIYDHPGYGWSQFSIKSKSFFKLSLLMNFIPLKTINKSRDKIHDRLSLLSTKYKEISANNSSHFVWIDEPELIVQAVKEIVKSHS